MSTKHTPGPWEIGPAATSCGHLVYVPIKFGVKRHQMASTIKVSKSGVTSSVYAHDDAGQCVGKAYTDEFGDKRHKASISAEEAEANARLITTAPDGYKLAEHILAVETDPYLQGHPEWEAFLNEAKALVNKAGAR